MSKLTKLIQNHTGGNESLNNILKEALLLDRKCQNLELALKLANGFIWKHTEEKHLPETPDYIYTPEDLEYYWLQQAVEQINNEQITPKQAVLNVFRKTCYCAAIPEAHDRKLCEAL